MRWTAWITAAACGRSGAAVRRSRSSLRNGLVVADGSVLLAAVGEHLGSSGPETVDGSGYWTAVVRVEGDPLVVWERCLAQFDVRRPAMIMSMDFAFLAESPLMIITGVGGR